MSASTQSPGHWYGGKPQSAKASWIPDEPVPVGPGHKGQPEYFTTCVVGPKQTHVASGQEQLTWYTVLPEVPSDMLSHPPVGPEPPPPPPPAGVEESEALAAASVATTAAQPHAP